MRKIRLVQWPRGLMARWCMGHHPQRRYHDYHTLLGATRTANSLQSRWLLLLLLLLAVTTTAKEEEEGEEEEEEGNGRCCCSID